MFGLFKWLNTSTAEKERDFYKAQFETAREENTRLVRKLEAETRTNRKREDELINAFLSALAERGQRVILPNPRYDSEPETQQSAEQTFEEIEFDRQVKQRVADFVEDGRNSGRTYTEAEKILLEENIRRSPETYGIYT